MKLSTLAAVVLTALPLGSVPRAAQAVESQVAPPLRLEMRLLPSPYSELWELEVKVVGQPLDRVSTSMAALPFPSAVLGDPLVFMGRGAFGVLSEQLGEVSTKVFLLPGMAQVSRLELTAKGRIEARSTQRPGVFRVDLQFPKRPASGERLGNHLWQEAPIGEVRIKVRDGSVENIYPNGAADFDKLPAKELAVPFARLGDDRLLQLLVRVDSAGARSTFFLLPVVFLFLIVPMFLRGSLTWFKARPARRWWVSCSAAGAAALGAGATLIWLDPNLWDFFLSSCGTLLVGSVEVLVLSRLGKNGNGSHGSEGLGDRHAP